MDALKIWCLLGYKLGIFKYKLGIFGRENSSCFNNPQDGVYPHWKIYNDQLSEGL